MLEIITHACFADHRVPLGHPERPDRIRTVWQALDENFADLPRHEAPKATADHVNLVHGNDYYDFIASHEAGDDALRSIDGDTHMGTGSLEAGLRAAGGAVLGVDRVMRGDAERVFWPHVRRGTTPNLIPPWGSAFFLQRRLPPNTPARCMA